MSNAWLDWLAASGARLDGTTVADFGDPQAERRKAVSGNVLADLSHLGLIRVRGSDAQRFLAGQLTTDLNALKARHAELTAWCTPKGRVLAVIQMVESGCDIYLLLPRDLVASTLKRFHMFVLRAAVTLTDASDEIVRIGCSGPEVPALLAATTGVAPPAVEGCASLRDLALVRMPGSGVPRFMVLCSEARAPAIWSDLRTRVTPVGTGAWDLLEILDGQPAIYPATSDTFLPQMLNLDALGAISFSKGCYPGQEVIARLKYRGEVKRRMYRARAETSVAPVPGTQLFVSGGDPPTAAGQVVRAQRHPEGGAVLLAVITIDLADNAPLVLGAIDGPSVRVEALPHEVSSGI